MSRRWSMSRGRNHKFNHKILRIKKIMVASLMNKPGKRLRRR